MLLLEDKIGKVDKLGNETLMEDPEDNDQHRGLLKCDSFSTLDSSNDSKKDSFTARKNEKSCREDCTNDSKTKEGLRSKEDIIEIEDNDSLGSFFDNESIQSNDFNSDKEDNPEGMPKLVKH